MAIHYPGSPRIPDAVNPLEYGLAGLMEGWGEGRERLQEKQGVNAFGRYLDTQGGASAQPMSLASLGGRQSNAGNPQALPALPQIGPKPASAAEAVQKMGADPSGKSPIDLASGLIGAGEKPHRAQIQEYLKNGGVNLDPATTAWCAAYVNATLGQAGIKGTGSNMARSFLNYGEAVDTPERGDIAVYSRGDPNGPYGHVGFVDAVNPDGSVNLLGGNQGNAVSIKRYGTDGLLGYRRIGASPAGANASGVQVADAASANSPFPQFTPQPQAPQALPDRETMLELFRNPNTRPLAIEIAKRAQQGAAPQETFSTIERPDGSVWQMNNLTGQLNRVAEGQQPRAGVSIGGDLVDPTNGRVIYDGPEEPGYRILDQNERSGFGIPADDTRVYQVSPQGQLSAVGGGGQERNPGVEARQRADLARTYGIDPNSAEGQRFILTGSLPSSDKGVTAGDRTAIREADDAVMTGEATVGLLDQAMKLSGQAYEGIGAGARATVGTIFGAEGALATREYDNIVTEQALGQLKAIFGGAPTEGERAILLEIQGSSSQPQSVRDNILKRAKAAVQRRIDFNRDRASELRGGTYYSPRQAPESAAPSEGVTLPPVVVGPNDVPEGVDPEDWKYMSPEDRAAWQ